MPVQPIPDGYPRVIPYLTVPDAAAEVEFLKRAFGAAEMHLMRGPDGSIGHGELRIGDSVVMIGQARGEWRPMPCMIASSSLADGLPRTQGVTLSLWPGWPMPTRRR